MLEQVVCVAFVTYLSLPFESLLQIFQFESAADKKFGQEMRQ